ncbi:MAG: HD domain-containing protein [Patescibacteria group bacterium]
MDPVKIIKKYYNPKTEAYKILIGHSTQVKNKALQIAKKHKGANLIFIREAAMLHDIGIYLTGVKDIYCYGKEPYIKHGVLGKKILEKEGLAKHAKVCERHIGTGLSKPDIIKQNLPLPKRNMLPISLEEKIICLADKFFTKSRKYFKKIKTVAEVRDTIGKFGKDPAKRLENLIKELL